MQFHFGISVRTTELERDPQSRKNFTEMVREFSREFAHLNGFITKKILSGAPNENIVEDHLT